MSGKNLNCPNCGEPIEVGNDAFERLLKAGFAKESESIVGTAHRHLLPTTHCIGDPIAAKRLAGMGLLPLTQ